MLPGSTVPATWDFPVPTSGLYPFIHSFIYALKKPPLLCERGCIHAGDTKIHKMWALPSGSLSQWGCNGLDGLGAAVHSLGLSIDILLPPGTR